MQPLDDNALLLIVTASVYEILGNSISGPALAKQRAGNSNNVSRILII